MGDGVVVVVVVVGGLRRVVGGRRVVLGTKGQDGGFLNPIHDGSWRSAKHIRMFGYFVHTTSHTFCVLQAVVHFNQQQDVDLFIHLWQYI